jgi:hypothetical protein
MENKIKLENLSEEEAYKLCIKLLDKCNQDIANMNKHINDTINYCDNLDNFAKKYHPAFVLNVLDYINFKN